MNISRDDALELVEAIKILKNNKLENIGLLFKNAL